MNRLNAALLALLTLLVFYAFWPNLLNDIFKHCIKHGFIVQVIAVGVGVFGGMWADKKLQEHEAIRRIVGALEIIDAELQSNTKAVADIKKVINTRPSYIYRDKLPSDKLIEMIKDEEQWVADISKRIVDKGYYAGLSSISIMDNRKLFEKIVNTYLKVRDTRLILGLMTMDAFTGFAGYSEDQKKKVINMGDQHFNKLSEGLTVLEENFKNTDKDIIEEEKKLLYRFKRA